MRMRAIPVILRSLRVTGIAVALASLVLVTAIRLRSRADDEMIISPIALSLDGCSGNKCRDIIHYTKQQGPLFSFSYRIQLFYSLVLVSLPLVLDRLPVPKAISPSGQAIPVPPPIDEGHLPTRVHTPLPRKGHIPCPETVRRPAPRSAHTAS